ncbi:hypothetical protein [Amnibacterium endophyticum]|uniref:Uncharacterized protein n=1 Tax=Amnibacterium endophyticum TaxID=2109337 RepID=A0ABW4LL93_9MICO
MPPKLFVVPSVDPAERPPRLHERLAPRVAPVLVGLGIAVVSALPLLLTPAP